MSQPEINKLHYEKYFINRKKRVLLKQNMLNSKGIQESPDYCVVMGDQYIEIRDEISKLLLIKEERINLKVLLLNM